MIALRKIATVTALAVAFSAGAAIAQDHHDDNHGDNHGNNNHGGYVHHNDWQKGHRMQSSDWGRGQQVDWHSHHLRQPARGYEWREVDGNYVEAAIATGLIASVIAASAAH
jgi:Ni/Co efflux regulator RcnB